MTKYWKELGQIVVNLKGLSYAVTGDHAVMEISPQLKPQLSLFDIGSYSDIYDCTSKNCFHEGAVGIATKLYLLTINSICKI